MSEEFENSTTQVEHEYGGSEIQVLEGLEAVRKRPGMYIGSTSESGLHHLVYEIVDNSIDEALAGYCDEITVKIGEGDIITVIDNGRGIPVDIQPQTGLPALEVVFTILHAGGKFGGGGYKVSGGLHGVGASVVNALSEWLEVRVHKEGKVYEMKFSRGKVTQPMQVVGDTDRHGTEVVFKPDPEMFEITEYSYDTLHTRMREEAFLNAGLKIHTIDERPGREQEDTMHYAGGIREFVSFLNQSKDPVHPDVVYMAGQKDDAMAEVAFQYNDGYSENIVSFANNVHTPEGGMHEEGFKRALTTVLNNPELTELYIVEGDSAGGSATQGRDSRFQAILPLWGKMLNVEKARADKVYGNDKLTPVITALGAGIGDDFDLEKLRYHKVIIMADADVDGSHIRTLLLTFFFRFMRPLIEHGYVYAAVPPLFKLSRGKTTRLAFSEEERDAISAELRGDNPNAKVDISRFKGLGEMNPHELWETTMDPERRTLKRIELDDAVRADQTFTVLMGEKVEPRKEFIERNAKYAVNLDY